MEPERYLLGRLITPKGPFLGIHTLLPPYPRSCDRANRERSTRGTSSVKLCHHCKLPYPGCIILCCPCLLGGSTY
ncbi:hypothetical protein BDV24DRAFT_142206 [Aspergillus arachidicola]|uniref:Uncharacterized protein n=1 Tax=Aspergillus arachidicola TaxID=656916 RepID=A0A5N6XSX9_9EURO|nr:hypothetical protein BDV24DRAFT_142206 [Aspergillus arachidicola]